MECCGPRCLAHFHLHRVALRTEDGSPAWGTGIRGEDAEAVRPPDATDEKLPALLFRRNNQLFIDNSLMLSLNFVDVTGRRDGGEVGRLTELGRERLPPLALVGELFGLGLIETFWHAEAEFCLVEQSEDDEGWRARFEGRHTWFTNEDNESELHFVVHIDPRGHIVAEPR